MLNKNPASDSAIVKHFRYMKVLASKVCEPLDDDKREAILTAVKTFYEQYHDQLKPSFFRDCAQILTDLNTSAEDIGIDMDKDYGMLFELNYRKGLHKLFRG